MRPAEMQLLLYFLDMLSDYMSTAGCNDMDQSVFAKMQPERLRQLIADYNHWKAAADPAGYRIAVDTQYIADFCWVGYLRSKIGTLNS